MHYLDRDLRGAVAITSIGGDQRTDRRLVIYVTERRGEAEGGAGCRLGRRAATDRVAHLHIKGALGKDDFAQTRGPLRPRLAIRQAPGAEAALEGCEALGVPGAGNDGVDLAPLGHRAAGRLVFVGLRLQDLRIQREALALAPALGEETLGLLVNALLELDLVFVVGEVLEEGGLGDG